MARTQAGFYMGVYPVRVLDVSDREAIEQAIISLVNRGTRQCRRLRETVFQKIPFQSMRRVRSLSTFEKSAQTWKLSKNNSGRLICPYRPGKYGGSEEDLARTEAMPQDEPLESVVHRLVERATQAVKS
jgi:hypothetical protein